MTIITGPRGSGRTTVLVQQFLADPFGVYCVPVQERKAYVWHIIRVVCEQSGNRLTTGVKEVLDRRILTAFAAKPPTSGVGAPRTSNRSGSKPTPNSTP